MLIQQALFRTRSKHNLYLKHFESFSSTLENCLLPRSSSHWSDYLFAYCCSCWKNFHLSSGHWSKQVFLLRLSSLLYPQGLCTSCKLSLKLPHLPGYCTFQSLDPGVSCKFLSHCLWSLSTFEQLSWVFVRIRLQAPTV